MSKTSNSYYSRSLTNFGDTSGICIHAEVMDPTFVWDANNQQISCEKNGQKTLLPCAQSTCDFTVANCVNNAEETEYTCVCKDEFPGCNPGNPTTTTTTTTTTTNFKILKFPPLPLFLFFSASTKRVFESLWPSVFGQLAGGLFCVWRIYALRLSKRKKAPPANCPRAEGQRGSEMTIYHFFKIS